MLCFPASRRGTTWKRCGVWSRMATFVFIVLVWSPSSAQELGIFLLGNWRGGELGLVWTDCSCSYIVEKRASLNLDEMNELSWWGGVVEDWEPTEGTMNGEREDMMIWLKEQANFFGKWVVGRERSTFTENKIRTAAKHISSFHRAIELSHADSPWLLAIHRQCLHHLLPTLRDLPNLPLRLVYKAILNSNYLVSQTHSIILGQP